MTTPARQHKHDVNAALRAQEAMKLRKLGWSYDEIAKQCGFADRAACWNAIHRVLARQQHEEAKDLRQIETARLDDLMRPFMLRAMKGEKDAALVVLRIMERRARLLGLDTTPEDQQDKGVIREYVSIDLAQVVGSNGHTPLALPDAGSRN